MERETSLIVGAGSGLSASLARLFSREGMQVALAARDADKLAALASETGAATFPCDASDTAQVNDLFRRVDDKLGPPSLVVYNASRRVRGPIEALDPVEVHR